jgi:cell division protein FtsL
LNNSHRGFQVSQYKPWKLWLVVVIVIGLFFVFFTLGRGYQAYELDHLRLERETLKSQIADLETRNSNLVVKNAQLSSISKIEHDAYNLANKNLIKLQQEILTLREELVFYQGIVAPSKAALGVNLQSFTMLEKNAPDLYSYKLVLTKNGKNAKSIKGKFGIVLRGKQDGASSELRLVALKTENTDKSNVFSFRYFQVFEGDVVIPKNFTPYEAEIHINPSTKKVKSLTETISWTTVMSEDL